MLAVSLKAFASLLFGLHILTLAGWAQTPVITRLNPGHITPGTETLLKLDGDNLQSPTGLWTSFPADVVLRPASSGSEDGPEFAISTPESLPDGIGAIRLANTNGVSSLYFVILDRLKTVVESLTNSSVAAAQSIEVPSAIEGATSERQMDYFTFRGTNGQQITIEVVAQRRGSPLDPVIRLLDESANEVAYVEDTPALNGDIHFSTILPRTGSYTIEVRDTRYQGGPRYRYRLRLGDSTLRQLRFLPVDQSFLRRPPAPSAIRECEPNNTPETAFKLKAPTRITGQFDQPRDRDYYEFEAAKDERLAFVGTTRSLGSPCDLFMRLLKADGSVIKDANISGPDEAAITNKFSEAGTYRLLVEELVQQGGPDFSYRLQITPAKPGFELSVEADKLETSEGGSVELKVTAARFDYDGPISLSVLSPHPGFSVTNQVIAAKATETTLQIQHPHDLPSGRFVHMAITGEAETSQGPFQAFASTTSALRKQFPQWLYPPLELDGLIAFAVRAPKSPDKK